MRKFGAIVLFVITVGAVGCASSSKSTRGIDHLLRGTPSGQAILEGAASVQPPLGAAALATYERLRGQSFEENQRTSDKWIRDHLAYYDSADADYQAYMREMVEGSPEGSLSMRRWLTDPTNVATWDHAIRSVVGDDGYARLVALNAAFPPGSGTYRLVFGGSRRYDADTDSLSLNGTHIGAPNRELFPNKFSSNTSQTERFAQLTRLGDAVRQQIFRFYADQAAGRVTSEQLRAFNRGYLEAGGCAIGNTDVPTNVIAARYLTALQRFGTTLSELGYRPVPGN